MGRINVTGSIFAEPQGSNNNMPHHCGGCVMIWMHHTAAVCYAAGYVISVLVTTCCKLTWLHLSSAQLNFIYVSWLRELAILAEGAIALSVTHSGGVLFAS